MMMLTAHKLHDRFYNLSMGMGIYASRCLQMLRTYLYLLQLSYWHLELRGVVTH
jgi:hypothetical protein